MEKTQYKKIGSYAATAIVALVIGFFTGKSMAPVPQQANNFGGGNFGQNGSGNRAGNRMPGGGASGEIIAKDAQSITIKLRDGGSKIIFYSDKTDVLKSVAGVADDIAIGKQVIVIGTGNQDGSITAQSVQIRPEGAKIPGGAPNGPQIPKQN
ncbi:MAG: hypothetical protein WCQ32_02860 [bacterium]